MELKQIQLKELAEEMQAITKGLEKVEQELATSEKDHPETEIFYRVSFPIFSCYKVALLEFIIIELLFHI